MTNLNIDPNRWYHLFIEDHRDSALIGTNLWAREGTRGAIFFEPTDISSERQRWQIYAINSTYYVLRTREGGPRAYLGTKFEPKETKIGQTQPLMLSESVADDSVYWKIESWNDGTFHMSNKANGTKWQLGKTGTGAVMDSNITGPQDGQRWPWEAVALIDNTNYSFINLPGVTMTPATSTTSTAIATGVASTSTEASSSPKPSSTKNLGSSDSSGLSAAARAGIGASIGLVVLITLIVAGLYFWRKSHPRQPQPVKIYDAHYEMAQEHNTIQYEMNHEGATKYELSASQLSQQPPAELPTTTYGQFARSRARDDHIPSH